MKVALLAASLAGSLLCHAQTRNEISLKKWDFSRDKVNWKQVTVPHDWAIDGPFDKKWDIQYFSDCSRRTRASN